MAKANKTYDEAVKRIEAILTELENTQALSMDNFQTKAKEAKELLAYCQQQLSDWEEKMTEVLK